MIEFSGKKRSSVVAQDEESGTFLRLKGQMLFVKEWESMLFLGTAVYVTPTTALFKMNWKNGTLNGPPFLLPTGCKTWRFSHPPVCI
jgi:hypothetical protein